MIHMMCSASAVIESSRFGRGEEEIGPAKGVWFPRISNWGSLEQTRTGWHLRGKEK